MSNMRPLVNLKLGFNTFQMELFGGGPMGHFMATSHPLDQQTCCELKFWIKPFERDSTWAWTESKKLMKSQNWEIWRHSLKFRWSETD